MNTATPILPFFSLQLVFHLVNTVSNMITGPLATAQGLGSGLLQGADGALEDLTHSASQGSCLPSSSSKPMLPPLVNLVLLLLQNKPQGHLLREAFQSHPVQGTPSLITLHAEALFGFFLALTNTADLQAQLRSTSSPPLDWELPAQRLSSVTHYLFSSSLSLPSAYKVPDHGAVPG